jgi:hypothetical protein
MENNKLLAEFLGNDTDEYGTDVFVPKQLMFNHSAQCMQGIFQFDECYFDTDWNWLMEVVEKIESIVWEEINDTSFNVTIGATSYCVIQDNNGGMIEIIGEGKSKLESVYNACIEFVKWFNNQNK